MSTTTAEAITAAIEEEDSFNVWVGCLACYNEGHLIGEWFTAAEAPTTEAEWAAQMSKRALRTAGHTALHEEIWCFDTENSPVDGEMSPSAAREYAAWTESLSADELPALQAWMGNEGEELQADTLDRFRDDYRGKWDSLKDYTLDGIEGDALPEWADAHRGAIAESMARDLVASGQVWTVDAPGLQIMVFTAY